MIKASFLFEEEYVFQNIDNQFFINPFYALETELFDFHLFRFSFGETMEEASRK
jgi:hypothetical protein